MTGKIKLLPDVLINKIAAGEVIERPASVVKELVENSLDAEAKSILVGISEGGLSRIQVNDDGVGMIPEELKLAVCRHATSKLEKPEDLFNIGSFGFRGEALPSITSVSQFVIKSRPHGSESGYQIEINGGETRSETVAGCDYGTYITVRNLFYHTPARRKFLKSPAAEVRAILQVMEWLSLSSPQTEFVLESDERRLLDLEGVTDKFERAAQLFGAGAADKFVRGEKFTDTVKLELYLSKPEICRRNRSRVMLLVNGRRIESKSLFAAMMAGYGEFLTQKMYPQGVIFITIDPSLIDVNVHPAKSEVRFADERFLYHLLYHLVRESLLSGQAVPGYTGKRGDSYGQRPAAGQVDSTRQSIREFFEIKTGSGTQPEESLATMFTDAETMSETPPDITKVETDRTSLGTGQVVERERKSLLRGEVHFQQVAGLYIVATGADSIVIIDQHAAHERILYEQALRSFQRSSITSQRLLFAVTIQLEPDDFYVYEREKETLAALGFLISDFGPRQVQLKAVPAVLGEKNPEILFHELLDDFSEITGDEQKRLKKKAASFACRRAIMEGDRLDNSQMRLLLENLMAAENPYVCPHGRPTLIRITRDELDLKFHRR